ncbi:4Fe-4S dicluster domain-containing protein [Achromobacter sp. ACM05]|uniref:4Fe-4S dicluster domain-containing protein n=1 Tax=Achromobacter TaxID=222 RepID=UPI001C467DE3|nr:4Fe-4S dicluster domain-containing protein [Achromobacter sp. ACM05]MBV7501849.1 ferredoxin family protein [Achromobacter sp. ACM05]
MIELISDSRCTGCNICVRVCPVNVFDIVEGAAPVIARQDACQTCFMCEAWCPEDAMYVSPQADAPAPVAEDELVRAGLLGSYRRQIGWNRESRDLRAADQSFKLLGGGPGR